jgi:phenylalanyl-tRNA synthetase beta chain
VASALGVTPKLPALAQLPVGTCPISIELLAGEEAPQFVGCWLEGVTVGPSPEWVVRRLEALGSRSINNVVDITNYVLLETGHPLHAFDYTLLTDGKIIVRHAAKGEKFTTLDGVERQLTDDMLVIADAGKAVALAGVMGGANTEIKDDTSTVLIEAATFEQSGIRATAKGLGLYTDSSYRFQRGVSAATV